MLCPIVAVRSPASKKDNSTIATPLELYGVVDVPDPHYCGIAGVLSVCVAIRRVATKLVAELPIESGEILDDQNGASS